VLFFQGFPFSDTEELDLAFLSCFPFVFMVITPAEVFGITSTLGGYKKSI
jgi:hypothetical protein